MFCVCCGHRTSSTPKASRIIDYADTTQQQFPIPLPSAARSPLSITITKTAEIITAGIWRPSPWPTVS